MCFKLIKGGDNTLFDICVKLFYIDNIRFKFIEITP